jgi:hypothetical protein
MADTPVAPDAGQTLFQIPQAILDVFAGIGKGFSAIQKTDFVGLGLVGLGLLILLVAVVMIYFEETVAKPGREFAQSDLAAKLVKGGA